MTNQQQQQPIFGRCIDAGNTGNLEVGTVYYLFEHGTTSYYVSRFNRPGSHMGGYQKSKFEIVDEEPKPRFKMSKAPLQANELPSAATHFEENTIEQTSPPIDGVVLDDGLPHATIIENEESTEKVEPIILAEVEMKNVEISEVENRNVVTESLDPWSTTCDIIIGALYRTNIKEQHTKDRQLLNEYYYVKPITSNHCYYYDDAGCQTFRGSCPLDYFETYELICEIAPVFKKVARMCSIEELKSLKRKQEEIVTTNTITIGASTTLKKKNPGNLEIEQLSFLDLFE